MEKSYYPLHFKPISERMGEITTQVDIPHLPKDTTSDSIITSVIPADLAKQLVEAYNEKYGCTDKVSPCIGGKMCCQSKISHHAWMEQNSAHSFTEGYDPHAKETDVPGESRIKRWREGPVMKDIDFEKVISDLKELAEELNTEIAISEHPAIQNAEAALGMLQALKEKRYNNFSKSEHDDSGEIPIFNPVEFAQMNPALPRGEHKRYLIPVEKHKELVDDIAEKLNTTPSRPSYHHQATVMVYAIEQYLTYLNQPEDGKP